MKRRVVVLLVLGTTLFIFGNLTIGFLFSTVARTQLQAMQMSRFFLLPSILLSGFMFPFRGMPGWAQFIGEGLPATHFLRFVRAVMLKGAGPAEVWMNVWPLLVITLVMATAAIIRYRTTLD